MKKLYTLFLFTLIPAVAFTGDDSTENGIAFPFFDLIPPAALADPSLVGDPIEEYEKEITLCGQTHLDGQGILNIINDEGPITDLNLARCTQLTDDDLQLFTPHCATLRALDLSYCSGITDKGIKAFADNCPELRFLTLSYCPGITESVFKGFIEKNGKFSLFTKGRHLDTIIVSGCTQLTDDVLLPLIKLPNLHALGLSGCDNLTNKALSHALTCTKLRKLSLQGCVQFSNYALGLLKKLNPKLKVYR